MKDDCLFREHYYARPGQAGMALISALLLLVVVTILAVSMFRSYGMQEKIAGNVREKQRALNAAISAQQYAEWYLTNNQIPPTIACPAGMVNTVQVCSPSAIDFTASTWPSGVKFMQFTQDNNNGVINSVTSAAGRDAYARVPAFYVTDLGGPAGGSQGRVYQVNAIGYGAPDGSGSSSAIAVVESTFLVNNTSSRWTDK